MSQPMNLEPVPSFLEQAAANKISGLASVVGNQAVMLENLQHQNLALQRDLRAAQDRVAELEKQLANESH